MPSPFPGMDPYLEDPTLWPNVHQSLITYASDHLQEQLGGRRFATIRERQYIEREALISADVSPASGWRDVDRREVYVEIQDLDRAGEVLTSIEVLTPEDKRPGPARELYLERQGKLLDLGVNLVEVDLLRAGLPTTASGVGSAQATAYRVAVSRAGDRSRRELYGFGLRDPLPRVAIPLLEGDPHVVLDLPTILAEAYQRGAYGRRVQYTGDVPPPPLSAEDGSWARTRIGSA